jgi:hypothetical protein
MIKESLSEKDHRLDFLSKEFDPQLALSQKDLLPPVSNVLPLDNLSKCKVLLDDPLASLENVNIKKRKGDKDAKRASFLEHKRKKWYQNLTRPIFVKKVIPRIHFLNKLAGKGNPYIYFS